MCLKIGPEEQASASLRRIGVIAGRIPLAERRPSNRGRGGASRTFGSPDAFRPARSGVARQCSVVAQDGKAAVKRVEVGPEVGCGMAVQSGLLVGDLAIVNGIQTLRPGTAVAK